MIILQKDKPSLQEYYQSEIRDIKYILDNLQNGRIYLPGVYTNAQSDGSLETNIINLRNKLNELFSKIENDKPSDLDKLSDIF